MANLKRIDTGAARSGDEEEGVDGEEGPEDEDHGVVAEDGVGAGDVGPSRLGEHRDGGTRTPGSTPPPPGTLWIFDHNLVRKVVPPDWGPDTGYGHSGGAGIVAPSKGGERRGSGTAGGGGSGWGECKRRAAGESRRNGGGRRIGCRRVAKKNDEIGRTRRRRKTPMHRLWGMGSAHRHSPRDVNTQGTELGMIGAAVDTLMAGQRWGGWTADTVSEARHSVFGGKRHRIRDDTGDVFNDHVYFREAQETETNKKRGRRQGGSGSVLQQETFLQMAPQLPTGKRKERIEAEY